ncbi:MAG: hypothetical protein U0K60_09110, partial [Parafannyhessea umbonata]|nr:hypothetical protein [Parafannyhessea umbonata]
AERTYDLLEQVAGRAGRGEEPGQVIVQTYWATHPAIRAVRAHDRALFVEQELAERRDGCYPPFSRLTNVVCWGRREADVRRTLDDVARRVRERVGEAAGWEVLGPTDCLKAKVKDRVRRHLLVKSPVGSEPGPLLDACVRAAARGERRRGRGRVRHDVTCRRGGRRRRGLSIEEAPRMKLRRLMGYANWANTGPRRARTRRRHHECN